jgi:hypothetical protein
MRSLFLSSWLAVAGCQIFGEVSTPPIPDVPLADPWAGMGLPVEGLRVRYANGTTFTVYHPGAVVADAAATWDKTWKDKGYALDNDLSGETIVSRTYVKEADALAVSVQAEDEGVVVSVTRLQGVP